MEYGLITQKGFDFVFDPGACAQCGGKCCTGQSGNVRVDAKEMKAIASYLGISKEQVKYEYARKIVFGYSLAEVKLAEENYRCIFFDTDTKTCSIYEARPAQCRSFPFWPSLRNDRTYLQQECMGVRF